MITKYVCKNKEESKFICNLFNHKYIDEISDFNFPITIYFQDNIYDGWCQLNCDECIHKLFCKSSNLELKPIIVTNFMRKNKLKRILNEKK